MPDMFPERSMPDRPRSWSEAFAALAPETPPADGWSAVSQALDARSPRRLAARRERRTNWLIGLAGAAVLALVAWAPLAQWLRNAPPEASVLAVSNPISPALAPATATGVPASQPQPAAIRQDAPASTGITVAASGSRAPTPLESRVDRARARRATDRLIASLPFLVPPAMASGPAVDSAEAMLAASPSATDALPQLQARSAQLEALVALARDERFASAASVLITAGLEADIAGVDAALRAETDAARRAALWQQRVQKLQQLAGVESTERWLAAQGERYESALVSVD